MPQYSLAPVSQKVEAECLGHAHPDVGDARSQQNIAAVGTPQSPVVISIRIIVSSPTTSALAIPATKNCTRRTATGFATKYSPIS